MRCPRLAKIFNQSFAYPAQYSFSRLCVDFVKMCSNAGLRPHNTFFGGNSTGNYKHPSIFIVSINHKHSWAHKGISIGICISWMIARKPLVTLTTALYDEKRIENSKKAWHVLYWQQKQWNSKKIKIQSISERTKRLLFWLSLFVFNCYAWRGLFLFLLAASPACVFVFPEQKVGGDRFVTAHLRFVNIQNSCRLCCAAKRLCGLAKCSSRPNYFK
jgi:hypothetical protein